MAITRLSGGTTPANGSDPRTFPTIFNAAADDIEAAESAISTLQSDLTNLEVDDLADVTITTPADGEVLTYDDGTSEWLNQALTSAQLPTGTILNVYSEQMTAVQTFSGNDTALADLTGLSITVTPTSVDSKFWVFGTFYGAGSQTNAESFLRAAILRDATILVNNKIGFVGTANNLNTNMISVYHLDSPATTSAITYKLQGGQHGASASVTVYVNRAAASTALIGNSFITVMEVAG